MFGKPEAIYTDNGGHFTGAWCRRMCQSMGVHHSRTVAYDSESNCRAKVAGRQMFQQLKTMHLERLVRNLWTSKWRAIQAYQDLPSRSRYSSHQILFVRDRMEQGLLWATPGKAHRCEEFMAKCGGDGGNGH